MDINHLKTKCAGVQPPLAYINRAHVASLTRGLHFKKNIYMYNFFFEAGDKSMLQGCLLLKPIFLQLTPWVMVRDKK